MPGTCVCVCVLYSLSSDDTHTHTHARGRAGKSIAGSQVQQGRRYRWEPAVRHQRVRERAQIWPQVLPTLSIVANNMPLIHIASARLRPAANATGRKHSTVLHFVLRNCSPPPCVEWFASHVCTDVLRDVFTTSWLIGNNSILEKFKNNNQSPILLIL